MSRDFSTTTFQFICSILFLCICLHEQSSAQWSKDPANNLIVGYGLLPELCSDSAGGAYITYEQNLAYPRQLMLERLNRYGYKPWGTGKLLTGLLPEQAFAKITEDGSHGVIVTYLDVEIGGTPDAPTGIFHLRTQRVDSSGNFLWDSSGVRVTLSDTEQANQSVVTDGYGGCIVTWTESTTLRAQRIDSLGERVWGDSGILVASGIQDQPLLTTAGLGNAIVTYYITNGDITSQFISGGQLHWPGGIVFPTGAVVQKTDQNRFIYMMGGVLLGMRSGKLLFTINFQKIDTTGKMLWDSLGAEIDTINTNSYFVRDFVIHSSISSICWPHFYDTTWELRTQMLRSNGSTYFPYGGIPISKVSSQKDLHGVVSSSLSTIYVWYDHRGGTYAQRMNTLGSQLWDSTDVLVSNAAFTKAISDGHGGIIGVGGGASFSICVQQVSVNGKLGEIIVGVSDHHSSPLPQTISLYQNYPNPFNPSTTIQFELPRQTWARLDIYNIIGQQICTLVDESKPAGTYTVVFNAGNLPSGVYCCKLATSEGYRIRKLTIIK